MAVNLPKKIEISGLVRHWDAYRLRRSKKLNYRSGGVLESPLRGSETLYSLYTDTKNMT